MAVDYTSLDFATVGDTFKKVTQHMKGGFPIWDELLEKGQRLSRSFEHTQLHLASFFDTFGKMAEHCVHAKGATRDIGTVITNLSMWHKGLEMRLREMSSVLQQSLMVPLATKLEEWKKTEYTLEKEHERDLSRAVKEAKDASKGTVKTERKLEEKVRKEKAGQKVQDLRVQLNQRQQDTESKYGTVVAVAKRHLSRALVEERAWYCIFTDMFRKVMDAELAILKDMSRLQAIEQDLAEVTSNPHRLPDKSVQVVESIIPNTPRGETPTSVSPQMGSPVQSAKSPQRVQSPPPAPPVPSFSSPPPPPSFSSPPPPPSFSTPPPPPSFSSPPPPPSFSSPPPPPTLSPTPPPLNVSPTPPPLNVSPTPPPLNVSPTPSMSSNTSVTTPEVVPVEQVGGRVENGVPKLQRVIATSPSPVPSDAQTKPPSVPPFQQEPISASPAIRRHIAAALQLQGQVGIVASPHIKRAGPPPVARKPSKLTHRDRCSTAFEQPSPPISPIPRSSSYTTGIDTVGEEGWEEEEGDSPLLTAIKQARLKRAITNDRSTPALQGRVTAEDQRAPL